VDLALRALKYSIEFAGLRAPWFSWAVTAGVLVYCFYVLANQRNRWRKKAQSFVVGKQKIDDLAAENPVKPGQGLSLKVYDALSEIVSQALQLKDIWDRINSHIIKRTDRDGEERFWVVEPVTDLVKHEDIIDYREFRQASAIITATGLFATFLAILVALLDVKLTSDRVEGLDLLIRGLSGKFMSSVAALFGAIVLLAAEKWTFHFFHDRVSRFARSIDELIPGITDAQILSDLHKDIGEQSNLFKHFNTDLSFKLKESFGESVGPTLERMVTAIDDLNQFLKAAEARKQESITGQLSDLLRTFEQSILASLARMGDQFNTSLSGSAQGQFERVTESLANSTTLLQEMNRQFAANQAVMNDLISLAKNSTAEQIQQGQAHVQDLTNVLKELMVQLQEKTGESLGSVEKVLAAVTLEVSNKVTDLSLQMASVIEETSGRSTQAAKQVIEQAGTVSARSAEQLERLLERHTAEVARVEDLTLLLDETLKGFVESIRHYEQVTETLRRLAAEANITVTSITQISNEVRQTQEALTKTSSFVTNQIDSLKDMNQGQKETWGSIRDSMTQYESIFSKVEKQAKELLAQIGGFLQNYSSTTEEHFNKLGTIASNHISDATGRIAGSIDELRDYLDELQGILAEFLEKVKK
jgi:ABC-type transporter Mla subunit MlaD